MGGNTAQPTSEAEQELILQRPHRERIREWALGLLGRPMTYAPSGTSLVARFAPEEQEAFGGIATRAKAGSPLTRLAQSLLGKTMAGKYLSSETNPYLRQMSRLMAEEVMPQISTSAVQAGRYGGGAWGQMIGRTAADIGARLYEPERQRMERAMQLAPEFARLDYEDMARLLAVGEQKRAMEQATIDALIKKWQWEQAEPWKRVELYKSLI
ncbi:MAG: hypothetical protein AB1567_08585 [bacterium]